MTPSLSGAIHRDSNTRASGPYAFQVPYVSIRIHSARYVFLASTKPRGDGETSGPHGLAAASPIGGSQLAQLEPLYGAVWTPDASLDWSPDGRWIALGGGFVDGVMVVDAWTGNRVAAAQIPGIVETVRWSPDGARIAAEVLRRVGPARAYI